jgi:hypothetical protein
MCSRRGSASEFGNRDRRSSAFGVANQDFLSLEVDVFQAELETLQ